MGVIYFNLTLSTTSFTCEKYPSSPVLHPLNSKYQDMEVKKGEFQIIGRVVKQRY